MILKKRTIIIIFLIIIICVVGLISIIPWLFDAQYNSNGISHLLVITIDKNQPKEYIGKFENHNVYIENLNIAETNFRSIDAKNVSVKEAIEKNLTSIAEWEKYAWSIKKNGDTKIFRYDNYEIAVTNDECIIRPKTK